MNIKKSDMFIHVYSNHEKAFSSQISNLERCVDNSGIAVNQDMINTLHICTLKDKSNEIRAAIAITETLCTYFTMLHLCTIESDVDLYDADVVNQLVNNVTR